MSRTYTQLSSCRPSADHNAYIYSIVPAVEGSLAAITSADEILAVDAARLDSTSVSRLNGASKGLTTLSVGDHGRTLYCGDGTGYISRFDVRAGGKTGAINIGQPQSRMRVVSI